MYKRIRVLAAVTALVMSAGIITLATPATPALAQGGTNATTSLQELDMLALSPEARAIALKVQCPICDGQSIAESHATIAKQMRALLQEKVDAGWTEQEILDFFAERYGPAVLREPRLQGFSLGVWVVPPIVLFIGGVIVFMIVRQTRQGTGGTALQTAPIDLADEETVARGLERRRRGDG